MLEDDSTKNKEEHGTRKRPTAVDSWDVMTVCGVSAVAHWETGCPSTAVEPCHWLTVTGRACELTCHVGWMLLAPHSPR